MNWCDMGRIWKNKINCRWSWLELENLCRTQRWMKNYGLMLGYKEIYGLLEISWHCGQAYFSCKGLLKMYKWDAYMFQKLLLRSGNTLKTCINVAQNLYIWKSKLGNIYTNLYSNSNKMKTFSGTLLIFHVISSFSSCFLKNQDMKRLNFSPEKSVLAFTSSIQV